MALATGMFISAHQESFENLGNLDYIFQRSSDGLVPDDKYYDMLPEVKTINNRGVVHNFRPNKPWKEQADLFLQLSANQGFKVMCGDYESGILDKQAAIDFWCFMCYIQEKRPTLKMLFYTNIWKLRDNLNKYRSKNAKAEPSYKKRTTP